MNSKPLHRDYHDKNVSDAVDGYYSSLECDKVIYKKYDSKKLHDLSRKINDAFVIFADFNESPLKDVIYYISQEHKVNKKQIRNIIKELSK